MSGRDTLPPVFVVGTGRCGSTLLSQCLRSHPDILSLSETLVFATDLGGRIAEAFPEGEVGGEALWSILGAPHPRQTLMLRHDVMMDEALYRPGPGRRYTAETGVPACTGCHGPAGLGVGAAKYPRLAGQHATYVESSLKLYRDGTRDNDPNGMMREVAHRLTDAEIAAVSQFVQGLGQ